MTTKRARGQGGFTLIELLVVVGIISVLTGVVVFSVGNAQGNAARNACETEQFTFTTAANASEVDDGDLISNYLKTSSGVYFEITGSNSFGPVAGSGFTASCVRI